LTIAVKRIRSSIIDLIINAGANIQNYFLKAEPVDPSRTWLDPPEGDR